MNERSTPSGMSLVLVWAAQLVLVFASLGSAYLPMGALNVVANLAAAVCQMLLGALFFMHLRYATPLVRLFSAVGLIWLLLMFSLSLADFLTRSPVPAPW